METEKFECPVCGNQKYRRLEKMVLLDHQPRVTFVAVNICVRCSVMFADPEKFAQVAVKRSEAYADETCV